MKKKINTIIIGLGRVGIGYDENTPNVTLTHYKAIKKHKNFKLIGCIDVNKINKDKLILLELCTHEYSEKEVDLVIKCFKKVWNNLTKL